MAAFLTLIASSTMAQDTRFAQTYTWLTEAKGQHEIELKLTRADRNTWVSENEFETGITDRFTLAPYLNFEFAKDSPTLGGWALEMRYRFGDLKARTILPAIYLEPQQMAGDRAMTMEGRLIGSYYPSTSFDVLLSGNLVFTRLMERGEAVNHGYAAGAVKMNPKNWYGLEAYGSWTDKEHFVGPTYGMKLTSSSALIVHFGVSLNKQDNQLKAIYASDF
ncbi:MAG: hypothetical protein JSS72_11160 [Armatimonadetes bacterium]|nr:hypothetical protein [Armatimonadota bacterium]